MSRHQAQSPGADSSDPGLPGPSTLRLEEAVEQLTAYAHDVRRAHTRLQALVRATTSVASGLNLPWVLRQIVVTARELVQARYAALGVVGPDGLLEQFIHDGMPDDVAARIGHLPHGRGVLGLLIRQGEPVRLPDLGAHRASVGFPSEHPPMQSFLGVPIRVGDRMFGNLYLTESANGEFSLEDEQLIVALAASAGVAIENARLFDDAERRRRWQLVATELTQSLFEDSGQDPVAVLLRHVSNGANADLALHCRLDDGRFLLVAGVGAEPEAGQPLPIDPEQLAQLVDPGKGLLIEVYSPVSDQVILGVPVGSVIATPFADRHGEGALFAIRAAGRRPFDHVDLELLTALTGHAVIAIGLDRERTNRELRASLADHDRIATHLHNEVIRDLFQIGMALQGAASQLPVADQQRILPQVDRLDATIQAVRAAVFRLNGSPGADES